MRGQMFPDEFHLYSFKCIGLVTIPVYSFESRTPAIVHTGYTRVWPTYESRSVNSRYDGLLILVLPHSEEKREED